MERILYVVTDIVLCVSEFERDEAIKLGFPSDKMAVIYNGVPDFQVTEGISRDLENFRILFVGRLDYQKGFDLVLRLMAKLEGRRIELVVVGDAVNSVGLPSNAPNIIYTGWVTPDEVNDWMRRSHLLVMPSRWEGLPMAALEAMSNGLPVMASNCCSFPEIIRNGYNGRLFETGDVDAMEKIVLSVSRQQWSAMGKNARTLFVEKFTSNRMASETISAYVSLCQ